MLRLHQKLLGASGCFQSNVQSNARCKHAVVETEMQKETTGLDAVEKDIFFLSKVVSTTHLVGIQDFD